jgi:hypothetical protein
MSNRFLNMALALLVAAMCACSSTPSDPNAGAGEENSGTVSLPLTSAVGGVSYRLTNATFTITGTPLVKPRIVKPPADLAIDTETLPVGHYSALLADGWVLERKGAEAGAVFTAVPATLVTPNPTIFDIKRNLTVNAWFIFETGDGDVGLGQGDVNIRIGVQDCTSFNAYESALAAFTVDCLGTIAPDSFTVNADGVLARNFNSCPLDPTRLRPIDSLLTLQFRTARLPFAKECLAGRYAKFLTDFANSGVVQCPVWTKDRVVNPITADVIDRVSPLLPRLPAQDNGSVDPTTGGPLPFLAPLKQNSLYIVSFATPPPGQQCATPAACAAVCAGGFPGFVLATDGASVLTDPPAWLLDTSYPSTGTDPFLRAGYYHPMSYYGGAPGTLFADATRACPIKGSSGFGTATGTGTAGDAGANGTSTGAANAPPCVPETCSFFSGIHVKLPLQLDCLDKSNFSTCVGYCAHVSSQ